MSMGRNRQCLGDEVIQLGTKETVISGLTGETPVPSLGPSDTARVKWIAERLVAEGLKKRACQCWSMFGCGITSWNVLYQLGATPVTS